MKSIIELEKDRMEWSLKNFPEATPISSLRKLEGEIKEVEATEQLIYELSARCDTGSINRGGSYRPVDN